MHRHGAREGRSPAIGWAIGIAAGFLCGVVLVVIGAGLAIAVPVGVVGAIGVAIWSMRRRDATSVRPTAAQPPASAGQATSAGGTIHAPGPGGSDPSPAVEAEILSDETPFPPTAPLASAPAASDLASTPAAPEGAPTTHPPASAEAGADLPAEGDAAAPDERGTDAGGQGRPTT